jgi:hypothetical protein
MEVTFLRENSQNMVIPLLQCTAVSLRHIMINCEIDGACILVVL